jgi:hypothetical protein
LNQDTLSFGAKSNHLICLSFRLSFVSLAFRFSLEHFVALIVANYVAAKMLYLISLSLGLSLIRLSLRFDLNERFSIRRSTSE